jgi:hypothetical protein
MPRTEPVRSTEGLIINTRGIIMWKFAVLAGSILSFLSTDALAVSRAVRKACRSDYLSYCAQHEVGSSALRSCMKSNRYKLSDGCTNALLASGEVARERKRDKKFLAKPN